MKRSLCSLLVASVPFGDALADAPKSKNAKVTLVYQRSPRSTRGVDSLLRSNAGCTIAAGLE